MFKGERVHIYLTYSFLNTDMNVMFLRELRFVPCRNHFRNGLLAGAFFSIRAYDRVLRSLPKATRMCVLGREESTLGCYSVNK